MALPATMTPAAKPTRTREQYLSNMAVSYVSNNTQLARVVREYEGVDYLFLDYETSGLDPFVDVPWLLALCQPYSNVVHVIDAQRCDLAVLKDVIEHACIVGAGLTFDLKWLRRIGIRPRKTFCVLTAGRLLTAGKSKKNALTDQTSRYLGFHLEKEVRSSFIMHPSAVSKLKEPPAWNHEQIHYAAVDVYVLEELMYEQMAAVRRHGLEEVSQVENDLVPVVADMEYDGIAVDEKMWRELVEHAKIEKARLYAELSEMLAIENTQTSLFPEISGSNYDINLNANIDMKRRFAALGIELDSLDKGILAGINHPAAKLYVAWKEQEKVVGTYGESWIAHIHPVTHRVHSSLRQLGADSGRFSSTEPNIQNVPDNKHNKVPKGDPEYNPKLPDFSYRHCFKPRPGYRFCDVDYSQMELRILAEISGDENMIAAFKSGVDLHSQTASLMFNLPLEQCGKDSKWRKMGKILNFAIAYGKGPSTLADDLGLYDEVRDEFRANRKRFSEAQVRKEAIRRAREVLDAYFRAYPKVKMWLMWAETQPFEPGYTESMLGRKRWFTPIDRANLREEDIRKAEASMRNQGKNTPIQASNADITKMAMVAIANRIFNDGWDAMIVNTIHDEILVEVREDQADAVAKIVSEEMIRAGERLIKRVPVEADPVIADMWIKG